MLRSLWLGSLPPLPPDPSNRFGDERQAAALGHRLFGSSSTRALVPMGLWLVAPAICLRSCFKMAHPWRMASGRPNAAP